jgi:hypothetical protein
MTLDLLYPSGKEVTVGGEKLTVREFGFGQWPKATKMMQPVVSALIARNLFSVEGDEFKLSKDWPIGLVAVMSDGGESVIELCAYVTGKPREFFDNVSLDEGVALTRAIFEVNADFFKKRILPMLGTLTESA